MNLTYAVTGIGNAIMDILAHTDDAFLQTHNIPKGGMQLVEAPQIATLRAGLKNPREISGGSVANSMAALAALDIPCAYIGRVADDALGRAFARDMQASHIHFPHRPAVGGKPTASCVVCVTPDGQRSMSTFIGACAELQRSDIDEEIFKNSGIVYIEGYLWDAPAAKDAIIYAITVAKAHHARIAFTLSDTFCVHRHRDEFIQLITDNVDIVFANEDELHALYEDDTASSLAKLAALSDIAVVTRAEKPALVAVRDSIIDVPALSANVVDTTGAGDCFAAGFLYGLVQNKEPAQCAAYGHQLAAHIIAQLGARSVTPLPRLQ